MLGITTTLVAAVGDKGDSLDIGSIIGYIVVGAIVGVLARFLVPGRDPMGIVLTIVLGIVGAVIGGWAAGAIFSRPAASTGSHTYRRGCSRHHASCAGSSQAMDACCLVKDGDDVVLYVDGSSRLRHRLSAPVAGTDGPLVLGTLSSSAPGFTGRIEDLQIYDTSLTAPESGGTVHRA